MRTHQLRHGLATTLVVRSAHSLNTPTGLRKLDDIELIFSEAAGVCILRRDDVALEVMGANPRMVRELKQMEVRNLPRLAWVISIGADSDHLQATIETREFPAIYRWPDRVEFGVDDRLVDDVRKRQGKQMSLDEVCRYLAEQVVIDGAGGASYCIIAASPSRDLRDATGFRLQGQGMAIDVLRTKDNRLQVVRAVQARTALEPSEKRPIYLLQGEFAFADASIAGEFRGVARTELDRIVTDADSYLQLWRSYNRIERENILARAREFQWLHYDSAERLPEGVSLWRFHFANAEDLPQRLQMLGDGEESDLEADTRIPKELTRGLDDKEPDEELGGRHRVFAGACVNWSLTSKYLDIQQAEIRESIEPPPAGVLFMSWSGDRIRLERREKALASVMSAECPMPQLGLLLENVQVPERRRRMEKALSSAAQQALGGDPTDRQREALAVALNTPDIALIQGPPGTGKTRVIAALQARLSEIDGATSVAGRALLTSYQHDAVENVASVTRVYGLPAIKVGRRRGDESQLDGFEHWRLETAEAVRSRLADYGDTPESRRAARVRDLAYGYLRSPCSGQALANLLREVADVCEGALAADTAQALGGLISNLTGGISDGASGGGVGADAVLRAVRGLRVDPEAFQDDGPVQAGKVLLRLEGTASLDEDAQRILEAAAVWDDEQSPPFLEELAAVRERLLDSLQAPPTEVGTARINEDAEQTLLRVLEDATGRASRAKRGEADALYEFLDELDYDPEGVRAAVAKYTVVLAATCQQAMGYQMQQVKGSPEVVFDTIVVDEAARANPLDLLIPMAQAERRIVLVGDHRQLPHLLDQEVERRLDQDVNEATRQALRRSMFERLFTQLRAKEASDGIRRTVSLNQQFRMHPILADFVSDTFYAPYGEGFGSHPSTEQWVHDIPGYEGRVGAWIDLPFEKGPERRGTSKSRPAEAQWIADEVLRLMEARPNFSVGIVSFYSAQVAELMRALQQHAVTERLENGSFRIAERWRDTQDSRGRIKERLRVGTVDAFQGKEFDVVLLSITRSNLITPDSEAARRKKYGHLMLENRLCVAMSRQKRLLITVGDARMFSDAAAGNNVPGLSKFLRLCEGEAGAVIHP